MKWAVMPIALLIFGSLLSRSFNFCDRFVKKSQFLRRGPAMGMDRE